MVLKEVEEERKALLGLRKAELGLIYSTTMLKNQAVRLSLSLRSRILRSPVLVILLCLLARVLIG